MARSGESSEPKHRTLTASLTRQNINIHLPRLAEWDKNERVKELFVAAERAGRHRESDREEMSAESPGNAEAHMVLSWYGGSE